MEKLPYDRRSIVPLLSPRATGTNGCGYAGPARQRRAVRFRVFGIPGAKGYRQGQVVVVVDEMAALAHGDPAHWPQRVHLTGREADVVACLVKGWTNKEIAVALTLAVPTVKEHLRHIMEKMRTTTRTGVLVHLFAPLDVGSEYSGSARSFAAGSGPEAMRGRRPTHSVTRESDPLDNKPAVRAGVSARVDTRSAVAGLSAVGVLAVSVLLLWGCSSTPSFEEAFSAKHQVPGSVDTIPAPLDPTWGAVLAVLSQQGFLVQQADAKSHIILAQRELRDEARPAYSYSVSATITLVPIAETLTRVLVAANQTTELHRKEYRWWKLLWLIPLIPTGTDYTTVVVNRDTVRTPQFYHDFFRAVQRACEEKQVTPPSDSGP